MIRYANNMLTSLTTSALIVPNATTNYLFVSDNCKLFSFNGQFYNLVGMNLYVINSIIYPYGHFSHSSSYKYVKKGNNLHKLNTDDPNHINNIF